MTTQNAHATATTAAAIAADPSIPAYAGRKVARLLGAFVAAVSEIAEHKDLADRATTPAGRRVCLGGLACALQDAHDAQRALTLTMPNMAVIMDDADALLALDAAATVRKQDAALDVACKELLEELAHVHGRAEASPTDDPADAHATTDHLH